MAKRGIPEELLRDEELINELEGVAKDSALLHGVLLRTKESPNSSEVNHFHSPTNYIHLKATDLRPQH